MINNQKGYAFPMVIVGLVVFAVLGTMLALRFSGVGTKEQRKTMSSIKDYEKSVAAITLAEFDYKDGGISNLDWKPNNNNIPEKTFTIDGSKIKVTIEDITWPPVHH